MLRQDHRKKTSTSEGRYGIGAETVLQMKKIETKSVVLESRVLIF